MKNGLLLLTLLLLSGRMYAQFDENKPEYGEDNNKGRAILFNFNFGTSIPAADMAKRFKQDMSIGGGLEWITANNFIAGVQGHYFFGTNVKEDPLAALRTPDGGLIGEDQKIASVVLRERGYFIGAQVGKLILIDHKKRSGLRISGGAGWMQHKIRLQDDGQTVPLLAGDYRKGYDRLTGGITTSQFVGWEHLGTNRRTNWFFGFDFEQGFTHTLRDWDFAENRKLDGTRLDLRFGVRIGWILPFYKQASEQIYY